MNKEIADKLGIREFSNSTKMMAGYYSHFTHGTVFKLLKERVPAGSSIADIGAGEGAFSERLKSNGYDVVAVENFCDFKLSDVKLYKLNLNGDWSADITERFDAVVGIEIIEHIENPFHFLRQIRKIVKEDGLVFISTPNVLNFESRVRLFKTGKLDMMSHPDHRTPVFPEMMKKYCDETGFSISGRGIDIDTLAVKGETLRGKILRGFARFGRKLVRDGFANGNSNIWILKPTVPTVYIPPAHA